MQVTMTKRSDFYYKMNSYTLNMFTHIIPPMDREVLEPYKIFHLKQHVASVLGFSPFPIHEILPDV